MYKEILTCPSRKGTAADHNYEIYKREWIMDKEIVYEQCQNCGEHRSRYTGRILSEYKEK